MCISLISTSATFTQWQVWASANELFVCQSSVLAVEPQKMFTFTCNFKIHEDLLLTSHLPQTLFISICLLVLASL